MILTNEIREEITVSLIAHMDARITTYGSQKKYARSIGIGDATVSNVRNRKWMTNPQLISEKKWIEIANAVSHQFINRWFAAETETYLSLSAKFQFAKKNKATFIFVDAAGIGKSFTADEFARTNPHTYIIKGSTARRKNRFIARFTEVVGIRKSGSYDDMLDQSIKVIGELTKYNPLIIIDEAGDVDDNCLLIIKQLYNALEGLAGIVLMGAGGLQAKLERGLVANRNGYDEIFSRFGRRFNRITPIEPKQRESFYRKQALAICKANGITSKERTNKILGMMGEGDMRRVKIEVLKTRSI